MGYKVCVVCAYCRLRGGSTLQSTTSLHWSISFLNFFIISGLRKISKSKLKNARVVIFLAVNCLSRWLREREVGLGPGRGGGATGFRP